MHRDHRHTIAVSSLLAARMQHPPGLHVPPAMCASLFHASRATLFTHGPKRPHPVIPHPLSSHSFITFEDEEAVNAVFAAGSMHVLGGKQVEVKTATAKGSGPQSARAPVPSGRGGYGTGGRGYGGRGGYDYAPQGYGMGYGYAGYGMPGQYGMPPYNPYSGMMQYYGQYGYGPQAAYGTGYGQHTGYGAMGGMQHGAGEGGRMGG